MKNPILSFRRANNNQENIIINLGKYDIIKGINNNSINAIKNNEKISSTLITKTREAADMSESS